MTPPRFLVLIPALFLAAPLAARGQATPFFFAGGGAFEPEIAVVQSGMVNDVQANVGPDPRYVTLTMNSAQAQLQSLSTFAFEESNGVGAGGFVGNVRFKAGGVDAAGVLGRHGMTRIVGQ